MASDYPLRFQERPKDFLHLWKETHRRTLILAMGTIREASQTVGEIFVGDIQKIADQKHKHTRAT